MFSSQEAIILSHKTSFTGNPMF